jgi:Rps23 Pro-64 3,4-dihydroxylase Tpa1-like proline 4-hydroxylase
MQANDINNVSELKSEFLEKGIVRVFNFLQQDSIKQIKACMETKVEYGNAFHLGGENKQASDAEIKQLPIATQQQLYRDIHQVASKGAGFLYGRYKIENNSFTELSNILKLINTESILKQIRGITNMPDLTHADGQATRYRRGDFLTRHIDNIPGETRRVAYVLGVTEGWHPDWGGLLQFFEKDGTPTNSWSPAFNSLTLFDVDKVHSVTSITQFAAKNRYSVTGWFRR